MPKPMKDFRTEPSIIPPLEPDFRPATLYNQTFRYELDSSRAGIPLSIGLERPDGTISRYDTKIFSEDHPLAVSNLYYSERIIKFLLWQRGGCNVYIGGSKRVADYIQKIYHPEGERKFDFQFMGEKVYLEEFSVIPCNLDEVPPENESELEIGRHLEGNRIGFDLGASDLKVSAVIDGNAVFSKEIEWNPREQTNPDYHREYIKQALLLAKEKLTHLDAIGGSSAGVYINNRPMIASLFRGISEGRFEEIRNLFLEIQEEFGVPLEIVNDGEVTALAGSMSLGLNGILGIAMGSSEAAGYVTPQGNITNWLNELAFVPIDYNPNAPVEEWSGDIGCGASYLSQQCVFRLSDRAGITIPSEISNAQKLEFVQEKLENGHQGARKIWESMAIFAGYAIAHYSEFYELNDVLILGRCTSGIGGQIILNGANELIEVELPELSRKLSLHLPDEFSRRVGQSIAAASLPDIK